MTRDTHGLADALFWRPQNRGRLKKEAAEMAQRFENHSGCRSTGFMPWPSTRKSAASGNRFQRRDIFCSRACLSQERARAVTQRFMQPDMFTGWGLADHVAQ